MIGFRQNKATEGKMPFVSLVVLVRESANWFDCLINSVNNQSNSDFEVLFIRDHAMVETWSKAKKCARDNSRFRCIETGNVDVSLRKNIAIDVASGVYISFLYSDDVLQPDFVQTLMNEGASKPDVILFNVLKYNARTGVIRPANAVKEGGITYRRAFSKHDPLENIFKVCKPELHYMVFNKKFIVSEGIGFLSDEHPNDPALIYLSLCFAARIAITKHSILKVKSGAIPGVDSTNSVPSSLIIGTFEHVITCIKDRKIYARLSKPLSNIAISKCAYYLDSAEGAVDRFELCKRLAQSECFPDKILSMPLSEYADADQYWKVKGCIYACAFRNEIERLNKPADLHVLKETDWHIEPPKISIIVPVFNSEKWIDECLSSIVRQTLSAIEIIVVDDGSTDGTLQNVMRYANEDPRIVVLAQDNRGPSSARNAALNYEFLRGDYVYFMDGDDWIDPEMFEILYTDATSRDLDILFCDGINFVDRENPADKRIVESRIGFYSKEGDYSSVYSGLEIIKEMLNHNEFRINLPSQLIKLSHIQRNALRFDERLKTYEDGVFTLESLCQALRCSHHKGILWHRRSRSESLSTISPRFSKSYSRFRCFLKISTMMNDHQLSSNERKTLLSLLQRELKHARSNYRAINLEEKRAYYALDFEEQIAFEELVVKDDLLNASRAFIKQNERQYRVIQRVRENIVYKSCRALIRLFKG